MIAEREILRIREGDGCLTVLRRDREAARARLLLTGEPTGGKCGMIAGYAASDAEAGTVLLIEARERLAASGAERVLGPMDGSPWGEYRLALPPQPGDPEVPPFLTEPHNPPEYNDHFEAAGFRVAARYESRIVRDLAPRAGAGALERRLRRLGFASRPIDLGRVDAELQALFPFAETAFAENPFYRSIPYERFRDGYARMLPLLDAELVRLAFDREGRLVGFVYAFPDPLGRGRVVLKTVASHPQCRRLGLSAYLADQVHALARLKGYSAVIHALMHVDNDSLRISQRYRSELFRRYALYEWKP
jgi:hypothetical protein